jgi:S1-C subfamily serine protease
VAKSVKSVHQQIREKTVLIRISGSGWGSGVLFQSDLCTYVMTARHCVLHPLTGVEATSLEVCIKQGLDPAAATIKAEVVKIAADIDVAILKLAVHGLLTADADLAYVGAGLGQRLIHCGNWGGPEGYLSFSEGILSAFRPVSPGLESLWPGCKLDQVNLLGVPGSSGGGVWDDTGNLVGIYVGAATPGWGVMVPLRDIRPWLKEIGFNHIIL